MEINLKNLSTPIEGGIIPAIEIARACGLNVGEPGKRKYNSWSITFDGKAHIDVKSKAYSDRHICIWMHNGDVDVYSIHSEGEIQSETTDNQALIQRVYSAFGFDITYDKWQNDMIDRIISANEESGVCPNCNAHAYSTYYLHSNLIRTCCQSHVGI